MNIKEAEVLSGVSRQNIRFYEREGLITPGRNPDNDYREYSQEDITILKQIRLLRMLDMPLEQVGLVLNNQNSLQDALIDQKARLQEKADQLKAAIAFCDIVSQQGNIENVDVLLLKMEEPEVQKQLPNSWVEDYKKVVLSESQKVFTFIPEEAITNPQEFTLALCQYADQEKLNLVITREGMYPEFTIDGIEYTAERFYTSVSRVPVAVIRCTVKHPEDFEADVSPAKRKFLYALRFAWVLIPLLLFFVLILLQMGWEQLFTTWEGWLILLTVTVLTVTSFIQSILFHYNENGKTNR